MYYISSLFCSGKDIGDINSLDNYRNTDENNNNNLKGYCGTFRLKFKVTADNVSY